MVTNMTGDSAGQSAGFSGLRFLLVGFEKETENQYVGELLQRKGQIAKQYDSSCTHVIASSTTYNDPICAAARRDGKALVTADWVSDCVNSSTLVDANHVLYRPLKDLNGIPGCKKLCICITGYQGEIRRHLMRMVGLMGAKFTKPLVNNVVTHLVCYTFEGEKYLLAKRTGIIMVNHFWLEDCLKAWTLLPESNYANSGSEAETMRTTETFAEDSGEDDLFVLQTSTTGNDSLCDKVVSAASVRTPIAKKETVEQGSADKKPKSTGKSKLRSISENDNVNTSRAKHQEPSEIDRQVTSAIEDQVTSEFDHLATSEIGHPEDPPICKNKREEINPTEVPLDVTVGDFQIGNEDSILDDQQDAVNMTVAKLEVPSEIDHRVTSEIGHQVPTEFEHLATSDIGRPEVPEISQVEEVSNFQKPYSEGPPLSIAVAALQIGNGGFVLDAQQDDDETTDLYVDGGDILSCGRTSSQEVKKMSDEITSEMEVCQPVATRAIIAGEVEMMDDFLNTPPKRRLSGIEDVPIFEASSFGDDIESSGTKRRRLQSVNQEKLASGPLLFEKIPPSTMQTVSNQEASATEFATIEVDNNKTVPDISDDVRGVLDYPNVISKGSADGNEAELDDISPNEGCHLPVKQMTSPGSTCTDEKEEVAQVKKASAPLLTLKQIAQSYKRGCKKQGTKIPKLAAKDKENLPPHSINQNVQPTAIKRKPVTQKTYNATAVSSSKCFAVGGSTIERTRLNGVVKLLGGKICRSRYQWRDEATHIVLPGPLRRTEKFLAGAAAGRWILKPEYLEASAKAGKLLEEEEYEWHGVGTNDKGSISLEAPRKWRISRATSPRGAFQDLRMIIYGESVSVPTDTLKRALKAGGGLVLAAVPPYSRHLADGVDFAIVSPGIPKEDQWVEQFLKHDVGCVTSDYFVDLVCHPSSSLDGHILYETSSAVKAARQSHMDSVQGGKNRAERRKDRGHHNQLQTVANAEDVSCSVCGKPDNEEVMLLCGDDKGAGCGAGIHTFCCAPPLLKVPEEDWLCSKCEVSEGNLSPTLR